MYNGWIKLHRCLIDKSIWLNSSPEHKSILITILILANHKPNQWEWKGEKMTLSSGQFITSLASLKLKAGKGLTIQHVRGALKRFEKLDFLTNQVTYEGRLITIINWDTYQQIENTANIADNKPLTNQSQSSNKALTPNKNVRREERKKKTFHQNSIEFRLSELLKNKILENQPNNICKKVDPAKWAQSIDFMIRIDKRLPDDIEKVIIWCQTNEFWLKNILSTEKLRKQFDQLLLKMKSDPIKKEPEYEYVDMPKNSSIPDIDFRNCRDEVQQQEVDYS